MNSNAKLPTYLDWSSAIGNFLLNFGTLEYLTFGFPKDRLSGEDFEQVREWHFKDRIERIAQYLEEERYPATEQKGFTDLVKALTPLRNLRNHIAHGHMYYRHDSNTGIPIITIMRAKDLDMERAPEAKHLELSELHAASTALRELIEEFQRLAGFTAR